MPVRKVSPSRRWEPNAEHPYKPIAGKPETKGIALMGYHNPAVTFLRRYKESRQMIIYGFHFVSDPNLKNCKRGIKRNGIIFVSPAFLSLLESEKGEGLVKLIESLTYLDVDRMPKHSITEPML